MDTLADSSFMLWVYSEMGTLATVALLFLALTAYREFVILPERRREHYGK